MIDSSRSGRGVCCLLRLVNPFHDGVEAAMAFDGVLISISEGLPQPRRFRRFRLDRYRVLGCPGLENALGCS